MVPLMNPTARPRRVRQGDQYRTASQIGRDMPSADDLFERSRRKKTRHRETSNGNDRLRSDDLELALHPSRTRVLLVEGRDTVAAASATGARIASRHGRYIDASSR